jgi:hypothetical protein
MDRKLTPVERSILCPVNHRAGVRARLDDETEKRWARLIDEYELTADHLRVLSRRGRYQLDWIGKEMWAKLTKRKALSADDLRLSIRRGTVTRIKRQHGKTAAVGVTMWGAIRMQFDLKRRRIGDGWKTWTIDDIDSVLSQIEKIARFAGLLTLRKRDLLREGYNPGRGSTQNSTTTQKVRRAQLPDISKWLREWRGREVLTQCGAAKSLSVPIGTYRDWEQGRRVPRGPGFWNIQRRIFENKKGSCR